MNRRRSKSNTARPDGSEDRSISASRAARTRERILTAATAEFATKGLGGARVDTIAARARANKRMLYHYYGSKQKLYLAVLERTYEEIREAEQALRLGELKPVDGMKKLVEFSFDYFTTHRHFIRMLDNENLHRARNLKHLTNIRRRNSPLITIIRDLLDRGVTDGVFRANVDPHQLYISIAGLSYFYFANIHTLSEIFALDLASNPMMAVRRKHAVDVILGFLRDG
jgi:TetR/AcrR family transcriptional regulator